MRKTGLLIVAGVALLTPDAHAACIPTYYDDCGSGSGFGASPYSAPSGNTYQDRMDEERAARRQQDLEIENRRLRAREAQRRRSRRETFGAPREPWGR